MSKKSQRTLAGPSTQDEKKRKAIWNDKLMEEFIDICIGEVEASNRPGTHFNREDVEDTIGVYERLDGVNNDTFEGLGDSDEDHYMIAYKIDDVPTDNFNVNPTLASGAIQERGKKRVSPTLHDKKCKKVGGAAQLSQQLSRLIDAVEKRSIVPSKC